MKRDCDCDRGSDLSRGPCLGPKKMSVKVLAFLICLPRVKQKEITERLIIFVWRYQQQSDFVKRQSAVYAPCQLGEELCC